MMRYNTNTYIRDDVQVEIWNVSGPDKNEIQVDLKVVQTQAGNLEKLNQYLDSPKKLLIIQNM